MKTLSIKFIQADAHVGNITKNEARIIHELESAGRDVDLVVFPECFLTGYPLQDLVVRPSFLRDVEAALMRISTKVRELGGPGLLVGAPIAGNTLPYNAAILFSPDGTQQIAVKCELPNNDVFDERRTFEMGTNPKPLLFKGRRLGVMICEDMWHGNVARQLGDEGAEILIVLNGSPMEVGKHQIRLEHAQRRVRSTGLPLVYLNLVGSQDELVFDGGSFILDHDGAVITNYWDTIKEESFHMLFSNSKNIDAQGGYDPVLNAKLSALTSQEREDFSVYNAMVCGMKGYIEKNGFKSVLLGLSGGLDSALVAAIAADAIGPENVYTLMMPSTFTGDESRDLAYEMAKTNGFSYDTQAISEMATQMNNVLALSIEHLSNGSEKVSGVAQENIQARLRGNLLMAISNSIPGMLVLSTGNKSEVSVGYCTLYGDMCGGFNPIKDIYKTQVKRLSFFRNEHYELMKDAMSLKGVSTPIPNDIITRPPTAELSEGQSDEKSLGSYDVLDVVLQELVENEKDAQEAARSASRRLNQEVSFEYTQKIANLVRIAEYKRRQAPPGIKISGKSFGFGWRYPITNGYKF